MKAEDPIEAKLDYALEMTFPASDPFTIYIPEANRALAASRFRAQTEGENPNHIDLKD